MTVSLLLLLLLLLTPLTPLDMDARERMGKRNGAQAGDPVKGAKAMYELAVMKDPPLRVVIGTDAYAAVMDKLEKYEENYKRFETLSNSTDVDGFGK